MMLGSSFGDREVQFGDLILGIGQSELTRHGGRNQRIAEEHHLHAILLAVAPRAAPDNKVPADLHRQVHCVILWELERGTLGKRRKRMCAIRAKEVTHHVRLVR